MKNKKIIKIVIGIVVTLIILIAIIDFFAFKGEGPLVYEKPPKNPIEKKEWVAEKIYAGTFDNEFVYLDYDLPSWKELEKIEKSVSLERKYSEKMNAVLEYGSTANMANLIYFGDELKDLGVNTYVVSVSYHLKDGELGYFYTDFNNPGLLSDDEAERAIAHSILMAKQLGFTVILFADYPEIEDGGMVNMKNPDDLEGVAEKIALNMARIGEKYGVEYVVTDAQMGMQFMTNGYSLVEAQERTNAYRSQIVPKIREIYSGKIMFKTSGLEEWENMKGLSMVGADLFGFTGCYADDPEYISKDIEEMAQVANEISKRDGVPWMDIEFFVRGEKDQMRDFGEIRTNEPYENYYQAGLESFKKNASEAKGFTITGWLGMGRVRGTDAALLVRDFFQNRL